MQSFVDFFRTASGWRFKKRTGRSRKRLPACINNVWGRSKFTKLCYMSDANTFYYVLPCSHKILFLPELRSKT